MVTTGQFTNTNIAAMGMGKLAPTHKAEAGAQSTTKGISMHQVPQQLDRRAEESLYASILVDLGVTYKQQLGAERARAFFIAQQIPGPIVDRILANNAPRRLTEWEQARRSLLHASGDEV
jgi:hypothetical protein